MFLYIKNYHFFINYWQKNSNQDFIKIMHYLRTIISLIFHKILVTVLILNKIIVIFLNIFELLDF